MPLIADKDQIPGHFGFRINSPKILESFNAPSRCVRVALVNNMPDSALQDTESQFFDLVGTAAGDMPVHISLFSLSDVPRAEWGKGHIAKYYRSVDELWNRSVDAAIVTGAEPRQPSLQQEPYWGMLTRLFDWAETNTKSTVLSCLAAHAGVLHFDGIERRPLKEKQCGVFYHMFVRPHALTEDISGPVSFPHSRWNEIREQDLSSCGYSVLTKSDNAGADLFVKKKRRSLFVHFQGHPEYGARTLLKEYRRDVGRYLRKERDAYPSTPRGYFDSESSAMLAEFRARAESNQEGELLREFPEDEVGRRLQQKWRSAAVGIYRNWLRYVAARKIEAPDLAAVASSGHRA